MDAKNLLSNLSTSDKIALLAELVGYQNIPVDIDTFIHDSYYLGLSVGRNPDTGHENTYKIWRDALKVIYPDPINTNTFLAFNGAIGCLHGDTLIKLMDGSSRKIKDLYNDPSTNTGNFYVYSWDIKNNNWKPGLVTGVWYNGKKPLYKVTIKSSLTGKISTIKCTHNHKFLLKDGNYVEAENLKSGMSIRSLYLRIDGSGFYEGYYNYMDDTGYWRPVHKHAAGSEFGDGFSVHHKDENKLNNDPRNLELLTNSEHISMHANEYWSNPDNRLQRSYWMSDQNSSSQVVEWKLHKLISIIASEYLLTGNESLDELNKYRDELVSKGYAHYQAPRITNLDEYKFLLSCKSEYDYKNPELVNNNLEQATNNSARLSDFNSKYHPCLRDDITLETVIESAKRINSYKSQDIAVDLVCSKSKVNSVISNDFSTIADFAEYLGIEPHWKALDNRIYTIINTCTDGILDLDKVESILGYDHDKTIKCILSRYNSLDDFCSTNGIIFNNHTVIGVELVEETDCYDLTVDTYHNYGIDDGFGNLVFTHNTGKSTISKIILCYDIYKVTCLKNPAAYFEVIQKYLHFKIFNLKKWKADQMVSEMWDWIFKSPYFSDQFNDPDSIIHWIKIGGARNMEDIISDDVVSVVFSEMNFVHDFYSGIELLNQGISRIESRFQKGIDLFCHIILDSSDTTDDAPVPYFLKHHPRAPQTIQFKYAIWDAKPHLYDKIVGKDGSTRFKVYKGDSEIYPFIIDGDVPGDKLSKLDVDRIISVPNELRPDFEADIILALNEKAGVSVETSGKYFDPQKILPCMTEDMHGLAETISVDFYGDDSYITYFEDVIQYLPRDRCIFGALDLGLTGDEAGFAIGYIENMREVNHDGIKTYDPEIVIPIATRFSRYPGQETSIDKICDLIIWFHAYVPFYAFLLDTYQSYAIKQKLLSVGINAYFLSVDKSVHYHKLQKYATYRNKVRYPKCEILKWEMLNLVDYGNYVDHPSQMDAGGHEGSNSKDISDAVTRIVATMLEAGPDAMDPPIVSDSQATAYNNELLSEWIKVNKDQTYRRMRKIRFGH